MAQEGQMLLKDSFKLELNGVNGTSSNNNSRPSSARSWFDISETGDEEDLYTEEHFQRITTPDCLKPSASPYNDSPLLSPTLSGIEEVDDLKLNDLNSPHYLKHGWVIYYDQGFKQGTPSSQDYEQTIKPIGSFQTVQEFWSYWNNINLPFNKMPSYFNLRLFKEGVKPLYEDPRNIDGGRWVIQTHDKEARQSTWNEIILAIIGEKHFSEKYEITGVVLSSRKTYDAIQIWNGCMLDRQQIQLVMKKTRKILNMNLDNTTTIEYQANRGVKKYNERESLKKSVLKALKNQLNYSSFSPPPSPSFSPSLSPMVPTNKVPCSPLSNPANMITLEQLEQELGIPPLSLENNNLKDDDNNNNTLLLDSLTLDDGDKKEEQVSVSTAPVMNQKTTNFNNSGFVIGRGFHLNSRSSRTQERPKRIFDEIKQRNSTLTNEDINDTSKSNESQNLVSKQQEPSPLSPNNHVSGKKSNDNNNFDYLKLFLIFTAAVILKFFTLEKSKI
ncbi:hypothetical protein ABK040_009856 [Willaertia magna]